MEIEKSQIFLRLHGGLFDGMAPPLRRHAIKLMNSSQWQIATAKSLLESSQITLTSSADRVCIEVYPGKNQGNILAVLTKFPPKPIDDRPTAC